MDDAPTRNRPELALADGLNQNTLLDDFDGAASPVQAITLSVVRATEPATLSKRFELCDGVLTKHPGGTLVRGEYRRVSVRDAAGLAALVASLTPAQALIHGVAPVHTAAIASAEEARPGDIQRNRATFDWPAGPGVLMLDYDPPPGGAPLTLAELQKHLYAVCPALEGAPTVASASSSTYIINTATGEQLRGAGGLRVYVIVADGRDISRAGRALFDRLCLAGHARIQVSESGRLLTRTLIDGAVWQPERLDFAGGAHCIAPLEQRRPAPQVFNNNAPPLDTSAALPDLTAAERAELTALLNTARGAAADDAAAARSAWVSKRLDVWSVQRADQLDKLPADKREASIEAQRAALERAVTERHLFGDFELLHTSGQSVTVGEILDDPDRWHGERFADPLEPRYGNDRRIARVNLRSGGRPHIFSHAHGGTRFTLNRAVRNLDFGGGDGPRLVRESCEMLALGGEVFQRGGELVRVADESLLPVSSAWLRTHLEDIFTFRRWDARSSSWRPVDSPGDLPDRIRSQRGAWPMPELVGIVRAPILRPDGSMLSEPGFDEATGLLLIDNGNESRPIRTEPSREHVRRALGVLWEPFATFPFVEALDRAVHLAACLTAVQRPVLPTAPAFGWNAYRAGSGKGKCAKAAAWLGGQEPAESPWSTETDEQRKRLAASLLAGPASILLDNINGALASDTLCAVLTSERYEDRRLGASEIISMPTRVLMLATGNNLTVTGDLGRRVLVATIDHGVESPERLAFPFCPVARVRDRWRYYRAAALTILRGFIAAGSPKHGPGSMGSFEDWDALIRQCVCWLHAEGLAGFQLADPADAVRQNYAADPDTMKLGAMLAAWSAALGNRRVTVADLTTSANLDAGLRSALDEVAGDGPHLNRRRLGRWIERHQGRVLDGLRIVRDGSRSGVAVWQVV